MTDWTWIQKIIPKDIREHPTIAIVVAIFLIKSFVATPDDVQAVNEKLDASFASINVRLQTQIDSVSLSIRKQAYEVRREIQIAFVQTEVGRLKMEMKHMEAYADYGKANKFQERRIREIPGELKTLDDKLTLIMLATYPEPFISVTRGQ